MVVFDVTRFARPVLAGACLAAFAPAALAQQPYPVKPVRLIAPLAPGGTTDITARLMAQQMTAGLGQTVIVENRSGAGGSVGTAFAAKLPPDGYNLLITSVDTYTINAAVYSKLGFDPYKDLLALSVLAASPSVLTIHPSVPAKSVKELVALSKKRPKDLNYGSGGTAGQLRMELLKLNTGLVITNIPYKGSGPALTDQVAGHVHAGFFNLVATLPHVQSGRLRALLVTGPKRSDRLPDVPCTVELKIGGFDENTGYVMMMPSGAPKDIVARLNQEIVRAVRSKEVSSRLASEGSEAIGSSVDEAVAVVHRSLKLWEDVVRRTGIRAQ
jgi:tripartite-type tricarboxylate transporter receptor subunit TctC